MRPEALDQLTVTQNCRADISLVEWAADKSPQVQKLVLGLAAGWSTFTPSGTILLSAVDHQVQKIVGDIVGLVRDVRYSGGDLTGTATTTHFPRAYALTYNTDTPPSQQTVDSLAKAVTAGMPQCNHIDFGPWPPCASLIQVMSLLDAMTRQLRGSKRAFESLTISTSASSILEHSRPLQEWASHNRPAFKEVKFHVYENPRVGVTVDKFYGSLVAVLAGFVSRPIGSRPPARKASALIWAARLQLDVRRLFNDRHATFNLLSDKYKMEMVGSCLTIARRP
ncbi:unnamed protein product [Vitrella brassicaformis CCMP3155]|uniref:Uncharacterized protein n=2 Tax=Vitrella brassicaformis TaxID=1169539 RepID=A0A0G4FF61_VITBC|nr:unnamed protein product [Vitrella brassicaformis CCMP3155]|eukprot:CEM11830.1 unnamed protein product [Vitrella brassicaformis CCMP3155]